MSKFKVTIPKIEPEFVFQLMANHQIYDWGAQDIQIPNAHKQTMGEGIKIAILDSGKSEHFEVTNNILGSKNLSSSNKVEDSAGHGTFVSGIIAAEKNDQFTEGVIGIAPKAKLFFAKCIDDSGSGSPSALVKGVLYAIEQKVDIISISAGMFVDFKPLHEAIKQAVKLNIIVVAAVGNSGSQQFDVAFPARYPEVIGVAAYDRRREIAPYSSRGINVKFAMPGSDVYSTWLNNTFCRSSGTSFACPMLSGICALILSKHRSSPVNKTPCTNYLEMIDHLKKYAVHIGEKTEGGFGTVDLTKLLENEI